MIDYYITGYFGSGIGVRKVTGNRFECCDQWWYYKVVEDHGKKFYEVTIPENGFHLITKSRLKDAKQWITENFDMIVGKLSTDEWKRNALRFEEMVKEYDERSENS